MAEPRPVPRGTRDPIGALEEALLELGRSAIRNRREALDRRATMTVVEGGKRGGRSA